MNYRIQTIVFKLGLALWMGIFWSGKGMSQDSTGSPNSIERGRENWFNKTYGGGQFFKFLANHPDPAKRIIFGFENAISTPRSERFQTWGTINDPDCKTNPNGGPDLCKDPEATGIIGIRRSTGTDGKPLYGISCASCHAGFDPLRPPKDPNEPKWSNIHPTIGNQFLDSGKIFSVNMSPQDIRRLMLNAWPQGTVDTTLLFNDGIMNPGTITAFWNLPHRPLFDVGMDRLKNRGGQGGEDDVGADLAALRVYTNIGVCFSECVASRPGQAIDIHQCRRDCPNFPPQNEIEDLVTFMRSTKAPRFPKSKDLNLIQYSKGQMLFAKNCASCHGGSPAILSNDEVNPLTADPENTTNICRALSTNWEDGRIWSQFSSTLYKNRVLDGRRGYRTMPLVGIWATPPFLHNQSVGSWAEPTLPVAKRGQVYEASMRILLSKNRSPKINVSPIAVGPFPAGTPLTFIFSRDPVTGTVLCNDTIENRGHTYGSHLNESDKAALIHWLKYQ